MFLPFALAALTAAAAPTAPKTSINDVKVGIRHGQVSFHIKGDTPISVKKVTANNGDRMMIVWIRNASLGQPTKTFRHRGVTVKAHQHTKSVEFDIMYRKDLQCAGNVTLKTSTRGIRALTQCDQIPNALSAAFQNRPAKKPKKTIAAQKTVKAAPAPQTAQTAPQVEGDEDAEVISPLSLAALEADETTPSEKSASGAGAAAVLLPIFLLLGMGGFLFWLKKKMPQNKKTPRDFNVLKTTHLSPKRSILVAEVEGYKLILASCENGIQLLKDLPPEPEVPTASSETSVSRTAVPETSVARPALDLVDSLEDTSGKVLTWPNSGLQQTPAIGLVQDTQKSTNTFDEMLADTAEDELLRRKIQTSRDLFLA